MRGWVIAFGCWLALGRASAQPAAQWLGAPVSSVSRQFTAQEVLSPDASTALPHVLHLPNGYLLNSSFATPSQSEVSLEPALLVISCERIKELLLAILGQSDQWQGKINLVINPARPAEQGTFLDKRLGPNGWTYWLVLPSPIKPRLLLSAINNALLVEIANRHAAAQSAEVPPWLVAGLTAHLEGDNLPTLILQPQVTTFGDSRLAGQNTVHDLLRQHPPLTFQELSLPEADSLAPQNYDLFCGCSQLFLEELLRFDDGRLCLRNLMLQLPRHLNWQTAFLEAFSPHFKQLLDVEKWWGLACVSFTGLDPGSRLGPADSWRKLQEALDVPVEVRLSKDELPAPAELTLQEVIADWDPAESSPAVQRAVERLELLRGKASPSWTALLDRYLATLQSWLNDTRPDHLELQAKNHSTQLAALRRTAGQELTALDRQRDTLWSREVAGATPGPSRASADPGGAAIRKPRP